MVGLFLRNRRGALEEHALPLCVSVVKKWDEVELVPPNKKGARRRLVIFCVRKGLVLFEFLAGFDPAAEAGGQVLHVFEAQIRCHRCAALVGAAGRAAAVSNHEDVFVGFFQLLGQIFRALEGHRAGDVAAFGE
jgi:hypothetical protein